MTAQVDSPILPTFSRCFSEKTLSSIRESPAPTHRPYVVPQTLLYSPSVASFDSDSPILRQDFPELPHLDSSIRHTTFSVASSTQGAYPTPLIERPHSDSPTLSHRESWDSSMSTASTAVEGSTPNPSLTARMSDYLPFDDDLYVEPYGDSYLESWNILPSNERITPDSLAAGQNFALPAVSENNFPYYPNTTGRLVEKRTTPLPTEMERFGKKDLVKFSMRNFARKVLMKLGIRKYV